MVPFIDTARLRIRPFGAADLDAAAAVLDECFGPAPRADRAAWLAWSVANDAALDQLHQPPYGDRAVTLDGEVVGAVGLVPSMGPFGRLPWFAGRGGDPSRFTPEVGLFWAVRPAHRRRGYAAEAAAAVAAFAFDTLNLARIVATTEHDNAASIAVMRRLGMIVQANPAAEPAWFQTVGVLPHPGGRSAG